MTRRAAALALLAAALAAVLLGGCGETKRKEPVRVQRTVIGSGATAATIFRRSDLHGRRLPVVLFAHGWGALAPAAYRAWIEHLTLEGNEVIAPRYQSSIVELPSRALGNLVLGVRHALAADDAPVDTSSLVAVGHSAGGALIADYAASAAALGLPAPRAIASVYPGRAIGPDRPAAIPEIPGSRIAADTQILALAGAADDVVGSRWARRIVATASRVPRAQRTLRVVRDAAVARHDGPLQASPSARRAFWGPVDTLIRSVRR